MPRRPRIYLAGPDVFLPNAMEIGEAKKRLCDAHGFEGVFPIDANAPHPAATPEAGRRIAAANERLIRSCDLVIGHMTPFRGPSMDVGTAYEMGYARSLGLPVLGYTNVPGTLRDRTVLLCSGTRAGSGWVDKDGLTIEDFGLTENLMIDGAVFRKGAHVVEGRAASTAIYTDLAAFEECLRMAGDVLETAVQRVHLHFNAKRWSRRRLAVLGCALSRWVCGDWRQLLPMFGKHLEALYLLRIPVATLALLLFLPAIGGSAPALLDNLFVDFDFRAIVETSTIACLTAASAVAVINAILVNGHERFPWLPLGRYYGGPLHWLVLVAPLPIAWEIVTRSAAGSTWGTGAALLGLAISVTLLLWIRLELQARSEQIRTHARFDNWTSRPLVYPHHLSFDPVPVGRTAPQVTLWAQRLGYALYGPRVLAHLLFACRRAVSRAVAAVCPRSVKAGLIACGRGLKYFVPEAGFVYVRAPRETFRPFYSAPHFLMLLTILLMVVWGALTFATLRAPIVPTLAYLLFTVWVGCLVASALTFLLDRYRIPLVSLFLVWALVGTRWFPTDHQYETLAGSDADSRRAPTPSGVLANHAGQPVILVAAAGGGIQSAAWTARVLTGLAEAPDLQGELDFRRATVLLSSVSGGSVGVYHYVDALAGPGDQTTRFAHARSAARESSLEQIAAGLVLFDAWRGLLPFPLWGRWTLWDRGRALERALDRRGLAPDRPLSAWEDDAARGIRPPVIFNATLVESGTPLLFATTRMPPREEGPATWDAVDFRSLVLRNEQSAEVTADIPLATAVRLSATFPFVSPVAASNGNGAAALTEHVADGGYYDNFGMMSLMAWLNAGLTRTRLLPSRVVVIQIQSFPETDTVRARRPVRSELYQSYAPLMTLASVRNAAQRLRNEQEFTYLQRYWHDRPGTKVDIRLVTIGYQRDLSLSDPDPPLSWRLSHAQQTAIDQIWARTGQSAIDEVRQNLVGPR